MAIPFALVRFVRTKKVVSFRFMYFAFAVFILGCGIGHLVDSLMFYWPAYRLLLVINFVTAVASWATFVLMWRVAPLALAVRSPEELEELAKKSQEGEAEVRHLNELLNLRMAALEAFNNSVCHDLNAPLRAMEGFTEALVEDFAGRADPTMLDYLTRVRTACVRMRNLVRDMMRLAQMSRETTQADRSDFSMTDLVLEVVQQEKAYPEHEKHKVEVQPGMRANGDPALVRLLVQNLLSNAFKFSRKREEPMIRVGQNGSEFFVRDNGIGFEQDKVEKLFQPFVRLHSASEFPGTGIGLTICKRVIDIHGGNIRAEGQPGEGACFYFNLGDNNEHH